MATEQKVLGIQLPGSSVNYKILQQGPSLDANENWIIISKKTNLDYTEDYVEYDYTKSPEHEGQYFVPSENGYLYASGDSGDSTWGAELQIYEKNPITGKETTISTLSSNGATARVSSGYIRVLTDRSYYIYVSGGHGCYVGFYPESKLR